MAVELDTYEEHLDKRLAASTIPEYMHDGLREYILHGRPIGHFLTAVLSNNLREAVARADDANAAALVDYVHFLYNYAPSGCWGSTESVEYWMARQGMRNKSAKNG